MHKNKAQKYAQKTFLPKFAQNRAFLVFIGCRLMPFLLQVVAEAKGKENDGWCFVKHIRQKTNFPVR